MQKLLWLFLLAYLAVPACLVRADDESSDFSTAVVVARPERKRPSRWRKPSRETPAEQLAHARALEERGDLRRATRQYRRLVHQWHEAPEALAAQKAHSRLLEERGKYARAFDEYQYLIHFFPLRVDYDKVLERQFAIANHVMADRRMTLGVFRGFEAPERALTLFERIVENAPQWERAPEAQFRIGWIHEHGKDFEEAVSAYGTVLHRYPRSDVVEAAAFRRALALYRIAKRSPRDEQAVRNGLSALATYLARYAESEENATAARTYLAELRSKLASMYYERARFYDRTGKPTAALLAYQEFTRQFPDDALAAEALERIAVLAAQTELEENE